MTILITGSLGTTSSRVASRLSAQNIPLLIASRSGKAEPYPAIQFDWNDTETWESALAAQKITAVYIVVVGIDDAFEPVTSFIMLARKHGVNRFVALGTSGADENGSSWYSRLFAWLKEQAARGDGFEWAVLRPSWFQQNFLYQQPAKEQNKVVSAAGEGKVSFVNADDIANVAVEALTRKESFQRDLLILGPKAISYDEAASILTRTLGREIRHDKLSEKDYKDRLVSVGIPEGQAGLLALMDAQYIATGGEDRTNDLVKEVTGKEPISFEDFVKENKAVWAK